VPIECTGHCFGVMHSEARLFLLSSIPHQLARAEQSRLAYRSRRNHHRNHQHGLPDKFYVDIHPRIKNIHDEFVNLTENQIFVPGLQNLRDYTLVPSAVQIGKYFAQIPKLTYIR